MKFSLRLFGTSVAVFAAVPALSAEMVTVLTGVTTVVHYDSYFGGPVGSAFTAIFRHDSTKGTLLSSGTSATLSGYQPNAPITSFSLTINGKTDVWEIYPGSNGYYYSGVGLASYTANGAISMAWQADHAYYLNGQPNSSDDYTQANFSASLDKAPGLSFDQPITGLANGGGEFLRQVQNPGRGYDLAYRFNFSTSNISVRPAMAVPEPAGWVMLIAGFGLIGGMARRRGRGLAEKAQLTAA